MQIYAISRLSEVNKSRTLALRDAPRSSETSCETLYTFFDITRFIAKEDKTLVTRSKVHHTRPLLSTSTPPPPAPAHLLPVCRSGALYRHGSPGEAAHPTAARRRPSPGQPGHNSGRRSARRRCAAAAGGINPETRSGRVPAGSR